VSKISQVMKVCEIQEKLESSRQSFSAAPAAGGSAGDGLTAGITFACLSSFDVDNSSSSFIIRRWSVWSLLITVSVVWSSVATGQAADGTAILTVPRPATA